MILRCGIVALAMALKYLNIECSVDLLMQQAKESNFTKNGEMFDGKFKSKYISYLKQIF